MMNLQEQIHGGQIQRVMEDISTEILGVSRDGYTSYVLLLVCTVIISQMVHLSQKLMDMENLFYLVGSMILCSELS